MDFGGDLSILGASTIFQIFKISSLTGQLKLMAAQKVASLYFRKGELTYATFDVHQKKKLGEILVEKNLITKRQLMSALFTFQKPGNGKRLGQILVDQGFLDQEDLIDVIQEQMREVIYDVLTWETGVFIFFEGVQPVDDDILLDMNLDFLMLEAYRRLDEKRLSPSG